MERKPILIAAPQAILHFQYNAERAEQVRVGERVGSGESALEGNSRPGKPQSPGPLFRLIRCFKNSPEDEDFVGVVQNVKSTTIPRLQEKVKQPWNEAMESTILACVDHIWEQGINEERPFAVSACQDEVESLRLSPDSKLPVDTDVHVACAVIKSLVRNAEEPLVPRVVVDEYLEGRITDGSTEERSFATSFLLKTLETARLRSMSRALVLARMMQLLGHTAARIPVTRMDANNLAICLTPSMLQWNPNDENSLIKLSKMTEFVVKIIEDSRDHCESLDIYTNKIRTALQ
uniref:Rho-GAP domain-containing protein n=1 Tax=Compsopogon caeruleus TaxID=31354 RepID=A0A7S1XBR1_9RHOD|mmetsp:Transcript_11876/g.24200  ORF Transcript_11876/g.24200 Transcript_11876/m.24200 type:complete len:291 (+) Transcript_11876:152-1024(+)|eukprot:CAMPEP_0184686884 /NCGR_PEP_ID=MMETSP0312-20130426/24458_1 /TAXON_ID=31354 /ORGANISM="Compsopogon coeruleus, Strain SAG 36.94" /LENGTH=290 /DNA_ID=CAMNT_0027142463 /DNA_START=73 /DNA_END=945 /DNA_ORIENTATION=+